MRNLPVKSRGEEKKIISVNLQEGEETRESEVAKKRQLEGAKEVAQDR